MESHERQAGKENPLISAGINDPFKGIGNLRFSKI